MKNLLFVIFFIFLVVRSHAQVGLYNNGAKTAVYLHPSSKHVAPAISNISQPGDENWDPYFATPGVDPALVWSIFADGNDMYVGGSFSKVGGISASCIAKWDGKVWSSLGANFGAFDRVNSIKKRGAELFAAANSGVYRYDGTSWTQIGLIAGAINGNLYVTDLDLDAAGNVYVFGSFTTINGITANCVAKWNGSTWSTLSSGLDITVSGGVVPTGIAVMGPDVYITGGFSKVGGVTVSDIARWNGTSWSPLGSGLSGPGAPTCLAVMGNRLYVGADNISSAGGVPINNVACWNGSTWSAVGDGFDGTVSDLTVFGNTLYAGGLFTHSGTTAINKVAKFNGTNWIDAGNGLQMDVYAVGISSSGFLVGGFTNVNDTFDFHFIAQWNGAKWVTIGNGLSAANSSFINCMLVDGNDIYVGGPFTEVGGLKVNRIAKWNGTSWDSLGSGFDGGTIYALAKVGDTLFAGGSFNLPGSLSGSYLAKWDGVTWTAVNNDLDNKVFALEAAGTDLYVGGLFNHAGIVNANYIAKWNGSTWSNLGSGTNNFVKSIKLDANGILYAGGSFTVAGAQTANRIAKWDGTSWSPVGSGVNSIVNVVGISPTNELYIGGLFDLALNVGVVNFLAKFNGSSFQSVGGSVGGISSAVYSILWDCNSMYVAGDFTTAGTDTANAIARWDGSVWHKLGSGFAKDPTGNRTVMAMGMQGNKLFAGGYFTFAGDKRADKIAMYYVEGHPTATITALSTSTCLGDTLTFQSNFSLNGSTSTLEWLYNNVPTGVSATSFSSTSFSEGDQLQLMMINNPTCSGADTSYSAIFTIHFDTLVVPQVSIAGNVLTVTNPTSNTLYVWQVFQNGNWIDVVPSATGTTFAYPTAGNYRVRVEKGSCQRYSSTTTITSLNEISSTSFLVYPNPVKDVLYVQAAVRDWISVTVTGINGKQLMLVDNRSAESSAKIDVHHLSPGTYFVHLQYADHSIENVRFVKL